MNLVFVSVVSDRLTSIYILLGFFSKRASGDSKLRLHLEKGIQYSRAKKVKKSHEKVKKVTKNQKKSKKVTKSQKKSPKSQKKVKKS